MNTNQTQTETAGNLLEIPFLSYKRWGSGLSEEMPIVDIIPKLR